MICCFTVKSFLFMSLPTAGMVIGWISTVSSLVQSGAIIKFEDLMTNIGSDFDHLDHRRKIIFDLIGSPILLAITLLDVIVSVLLIFGIVKKSHLLLVPWLINNGISLLIRLILGILLIAFILGVSNGESPASWIVLFILAVMIFICMVWNAIYSLFQSIRKDNERYILDVENLVGNANPHSYELFKNAE